MQNNNREFILVKKQDEADGVVSLFFKPTDNLPYEFISGQYVDIKPPTISGHGKSYTISSTPDDDLVRLTIQRKGTVSSAIIDLNIGDKLFFEGPYGSFYPEPQVKDVVMIAGGVGITPFYSIIKNRLNLNNETKFCLIYSNKTKGGITFFDDLNEIATNNQNLQIVYCLTQEKTDDALIKEYSRINGDIINKYVVPNQDKCYYICGSISFVRDMWKTLKAIGVSEDNIFMESFY